MNNRLDEEMGRKVAALYYSYLQVPSLFLAGSCLHGYTLLATYTKRKET